MLKKCIKFDAQADTGYFVAKGTLDRLYLSKFWSNVHLNYSARNTTTQYLAIKFGSIASKILFQKAIWKIRLNSTFCTDLEIGDVFFQYQQPVPNYYVETG